MARVLLLIAGCGPCEPLVGWYDGTISGDRDGNVELEATALDESTVAIEGFWSPYGLPRHQEPNFVVERSCAEHDAVSEVVLDQTWTQLSGTVTRWTGSATFKMDKQGMTGGWFFDVEDGPAEDQLSQSEQIAGTWEALP